ncbi:MAG TPA: riboflavin synthase [Candidatus Angelobacter sp.]|jgi:riboflavin synthase|nr:riboflavin synthase [Candidatus Angelobacter sp.]
MFTGLIQETGQIVSLKLVSGKTRITVNAQSIPAELKLGDSVAVSGVCLTAVEIDRHCFACDLADETLKRTSLRKLNKYSVVNLELPTQANARLGGHVVQGHVDGVGKLLSLERIKGREDWRLAIEIPKELLRYVVSQGSITLEGISLTVAHINSNQIEIAIIPHTYQATNLHTLKRDGLLNIEVDVLAKYAEKSIREKPLTSLSVPDLIRRGF